MSDFDLALSVALGIGLAAATGFRVAPMPDAQVFVTGDVRLEDVVGYLEAGAAMVGLSRHLLGDALEPDGDLTALGARAAAIVGEVRARHHAKQNMEEEVGH